MEDAAGEEKDRSSFWYWFSWSPVSQPTLSAIMTQLQTFWQFWQRSLFSRIPCVLQRPSRFSCWELSELCLETLRISYNHQFVSILSLRSNSLKRETCLLLCYMYIKKSRGHIMNGGAQEITAESHNGLLNPLKISNRLSVHSRPF